MKNLSKKGNILVTGGAGYIGSHTCKALAKAGFNPIVVDDLSNGFEKNVKWGPFYNCDLRNYDELVQIFQETRPEAVIHLAGLIVVPHSVDDPTSYYDANVSGSIQLLKAMNKVGCANIVFSSSCAVYGIPKYLPLTEDHPCAPINPYGQSKRMVENILQDASNAGQLNFTALRYFNASGADPDGELAEEHEPETHLIPLLLKTALGDQKKFCLFGDKYDTKDGSCIRDFVHVNDLAAAHIQSVRYLLKGGHSQFFNLGSGSGYSVKEIFEIAQRVTGVEIPYEIKPPRPGDSPKLLADNKKAKDILGWQPQFDRIEDHIQHAWQIMSRLKKGAA